jgi:hypothetical protein
MIQSIEDGRKEDGNRSIADKIIKRLHDLEKTVENNYGRWAWELLQNAKDSNADDARVVDVCLMRAGDTVTFFHNGNHFTEHDIRGLINQISSKEVEEGQKSTRVGRFGTGFITTHLLSKVVSVKGLVETLEKEFYQFEFPLDREGTTTTFLAPKIEATWHHFHQSVKRVSTFDPKQLNTSFTYLLTTDRQRTTAQKGIEEFIRLMPFVLAFIPKIGKVTIINESQIVVIERQGNLISDFIVQVSRTENNQTQNIQIALCQNALAAVAIEIDALTNSVKELKEVPRLFCDFPLIGTEKFHFPVVVNSFYFNPQTERDGIWLKGNEDAEVQVNQAILVQAVSLYEDLISKLSSLEIRELYFAASTKIPDVNEKYFDVDWYKGKVQHGLRQAIVKTPLVDTVSYGRCPIKGDGAYVDFPHHGTKKTRERLWFLGNKLNGSTLMLPEKSAIDFWDEIITDDSWGKEYYLGVEQYAEFFTEWSSKRGNNIEGFREVVGENQDEFEWLNEFYNLVIDEEKSELFNQFELVPNQNGTFKKVNERTNSKINTILYNDEINDETLLEILKLLGSDWKEYLIHPEIKVALTSAVLKKQDIASTIAKTFSEYKGDWNANAVKAIVLLTEWLEYNSELGKELFPELYRRRAELFMNTIEDKESLYQIMKSKTPLATLSEIAAAIENDPEILDLIARRQRERQEELERNEIGEKVEAVLAEALKQHGFEVKKVAFGRDLVISLQKNLARYSIEVKSTSRESYVSMTANQATSAVKEAANYALCVIQKNGLEVDTEFVKNNARFVTNIGVLLRGKVEQVGAFENSKTQIANTNEDIDLFYENSLEYKYKISSKVWTQGMGFLDFVNFIKLL